MKHPGKIINDPVYGFIAIDNLLIFRILEHPWYQRLRRIYQMALAHLVYPGAVHTRLHHSLGAYHLMHQAIHVLKQKGTAITEEEEIAAKAAILLHDIGHGPFSHALEHVLIPNEHHETLGLQIMEQINRDMNGALDLAISIFKNTYHKPFLHQLISGQLDVDRMDYLTRDSFYTGVSEGVIGYDRILKMLVVHNNQLMVEQKGIHSIEKFLVARRLMYGQVYLHKAVLAAEKMLIKIIQRAKEVKAIAASEVLNHILHDVHYTGYQLADFCAIDDFDIMSSIKKWAYHPDKTLSLLSSGILNRRLYKCRLQSEPFDENVVNEYKQKALAAAGLSTELAEYLVFTGETGITTYKPADEHILILYKDGSIKDISEVDNALIHHTLAMPVKKFYICRFDFQNFQS